MIEFHTPTPEDRQWANACLAEQGEISCEHNFNSIYLWSHACGKKVARWQDNLLVCSSSGAERVYQFPAGKDPLAAVDALSEHAAQQGEILEFVCVTAAQRAALEGRWPGRFQFSEMRSNFDYVYDVNKLADLTGKKLHGKRNHIHRFDEQFPDWMAEPITDKNVSECVAFERAWAEERNEIGDEMLSEETVVVLEALYLREELELEGLLIRAAGKVVAFSMASRTTAESFDVHFEKADGTIQGAYPVINREMARMLRSKYPELKYLNREEDMGLEGLRKAKLSYYPEILLEKYTAREVTRRD